MLNVDAERFGAREDVLLLEFHKPPAVLIPALAGHVGPGLGAGAGPGHGGLELVVLISDLTPEEKSELYDMFRDEWNIPPDEEIDESDMNLEGTFYAYLQKRRRQ